MAYRSQVQPSTMSRDITMGQVPRTARRDRNPDSYSINHTHVQ